MRVGYLLIGFLLLGCATPAEQVVNKDAVARIDSTLSHFVESGTLAGASALIRESGREVYFNAFGMADREAGTRMSRESIVQIFSMTKPLTGVALMTLFEQGAFSLDDSVSQYLPEFAPVRVYEGEDASGKPILVAPRRPITIRDLTRHTAGLINDVQTPGVGPFIRRADPMNPANTLSEMGRRLATVPLLYHPGERWSYGPAVDVQALLIEHISGQPFETYLREHVLNPLRMNETRYVVPSEDLTRFAAMYQRSENGRLSRSPNESAWSFHTREWPLQSGGSGLTSTLDDYMRFARMLLNEGELDGVRILKPETVRLMATNQLEEAVEQRSWLPSKGQVGFGIDFAVRLRPPTTDEENYGVVGEFFWDGAASTLFWVDPENELTALLFVQLRPFDGVGLHRAFRRAVYGAP